MILGTRTGSFNFSMLTVHMTTVLLCRTLLGGIIFGSVHRLEGLVGGFCGGAAFPVMPQWHGVSAAWRCRISMTDAWWWTRVGRWRCLAPWGRQRQAWKCRSSVPALKMDWWKMVVTAFAACACGVRWERDGLVCHQTRQFSLVGPSGFRCWALVWCMSMQPRQSAPLNWIGVATVAAKMMALDLLMYYFVRSWWTIEEMVACITPGTSSF